MPPLERLRFLSPALARWAVHNAIFPARAWVNLGEGADVELYRHFPVTAVADLETHFKSVVSLTINTGSPYLERGLILAKDRLKSAVDVLPSLHRKTVSRQT